MKEKQSKNQTPSGLTNDDDTDKMDDAIESGGGKIDVERDDSPNMETVLPDHGKDKASLFSMASLMRPSVTSSSSITPKPVLTGSSPSVAEVTPSLGNIASLAASGFLRNGLNITNGIK